MSPPQSKLWAHFRKKDGKIAVCKLCLREIKYSGNTSNLAKHLKGNHKSFTLECNTSKSGLKPSQSAITKFVSNPDNAVASGSSIPLSYPSTSKDEEMEIVNTIEDIKVITTSKNNEPQQLVLVSPITEAFNKASSYAIGGIRHAKLTNAILYFICKDNRPFAVTEGEGFKKLIHELAPTFKIPSTKFLKQQLTMKYEVISSRMKLRFQNAEHICLSSDVWTETMAEKAFLGVTAHFLEGTNIVSVDLACKQLNTNHTAEYLSNELEQILATFSIDKEKIIAIVTDNGANIVAAAKKVFPNKQIPCFAHTLNLVTNSAISLPCIKGIISKVRDIVKFIKNSVNNSDKLRKIQLESNIPEGKVKKVILDVKTRWNSTFYMLQRFLELLSVLSQILITDSTSPDMPTAAELSDIRQLTTLLKPIECATKEISGEKYVTISKIIPMVNCLTSHIQSFEASTELIKTVKKSIESEVNKRFGLIEQNSRLATSTLLDPRFKNIHFQNPTACGNAISKLKIASALNETNSSGDSEEEKSEPHTFDFWQTHKELAQGKNKKGEKTDSSELTLYLTNPVSPLKSNPLDIWEEMKSVFPVLYKQAREHLSMMATSVPCERLFSKTGSIMTQERNRLSGKYLDLLVFMKSASDKEWFE